MKQKLTQQATVGVLASWLISMFALLCAVLIRLDLFLESLAATSAPGAGASSPVTTYASLALLLVLVSMAIVKKTRKFIPVLIVPAVCGFGLLAVGRSMFASSPVVIALHLSDACGMLSICLVALVLMGCMLALAMRKQKAGMPPPIPQEEQIQE